jgi:hypothetical protein
VTRGRRPDSVATQWAKGKTTAGQPPLVGPLSREFLDLAADPRNPLCWLTKDWWIFVRGEVRKAERKTGRKLSRRAYEWLLKSLDARSN